MATSSLFIPVVLDKKGMEIIAAHLREVEGYEIPDSELSAPSPCLTPEEVEEFFKDVDVDDIGP